MKTVAGIKGVDSIAFDEKDTKITVIGEADPVCLTASLRKFGFADLVSVGPSKEPEKKPDPVKNPQPEKKQPEKKPDDKKVPEEKAAEKRELLQQNITYVVLPSGCDHYSNTTYYLSDENPNSCCIV